MAIKYRKKEDTSKRFENIEAAQNDVQQNNGRESKIYRTIFYIVAAIFFVLTPILSLNSGISGDEKSSYVHSSRVYDYFAKGDTAALKTHWDQPALLPKLNSC